MVRLGRVGDQWVTAPIRVGADGWDAADAYMVEGDVKPFGGFSPGIVVGGCEPGLMLMERMLREMGAGAVAVSLSTASALECLMAGRLHAAVVHGPEADPAPLGVVVPPVMRFHLARWRVGLAAPPDAVPGWWKKALSGKGPVVQREPGAGVQLAFRAAIAQGRKAVPGPIATSHIDASRLALATGLPAVTIEPAATAVGAAFHPIEVHTAQLWVDRTWIGDEVIGQAMSVLTGGRFQRQLAGVGGYDLAGSGDRAA